MTHILWVSGSIWGAQKKNGCLQDFGSLKKSFSNDKQYLCTKQKHNLTHLLHFQYLVASHQTVNEWINNLHVQKTTRRHKQATIATIFTYIHTKLPQLTWVPHSLSSKSASQILGSVFDPFLPSPICTPQSSGYKLSWVSGDSWTPLVNSPKAL